MGLALKDSPPGFDPGRAVDSYGDDDDDPGYAEDRAALAPAGRPSALVRPLRGLTPQTGTRGRARRMPTPTKGPRLGGGPAHERLMLANLATALFEHGRITTTEAKAKRLRPLAERLITKAKRGDLHARRQVLTVDPRQDRGAHAVHRDRAALREPPGRLHPHHQDRSAQGRQRARWP